MSETFTIGADGTQPFGGPISLAQTFSPIEEHILQFFDAELRVPTGAPPVLPYIRDTKLDGSPGPHVISNLKSRITLPTLLTGPSRYRFQMTPIKVEPGITYALELAAMPSADILRSSWEINRTTATYPRGHAWLSEDWDVTWTPFPAVDCMFAEFGNPPLPKPEPPPPIEYFAPIGIRYTPTWFGLLIVLATATPCHLTCYYTKIKPLKHSISRTVRGLTVPWGTYFCFTGWHALEQIEPGDTLYHTFNFEEWPVCLTRWFTFRGEVNNIESPSVGPIFEYHNLGARLFEHYISGDDGEGSIWRLEHRAHTFTPLDSHKIIYVRLKLFRLGLPGTLTARIYATLNGKPTGSPLCSGITDGNTLPTDPPYEWRGILLDPSYNLTSGVRYAIVLKSAGVVADNRVNWRIDCSAPTYPRGEALYSHDGGATWTKVPACDYMFEEWGTPSE